MAPVKYEKLTFTPSRVIKIERTPEDALELWPTVVLKPGREVTFGPFRDWLDEDDWYIDCGRVYRVLHCDVGRVYAQLTMEAEEAALNSAPCDCRHPPEPHKMHPYGDYCVKCRRTVEYVVETSRRAEKNGIAAWAEESDGALYGIDRVNPSQTARAVMVDTIIASQVAAGGVDTEGTRAQAERWCAWLCGCVCEGMRATTDDSALRLANTDAMRPGGWRVGRDGRLVYAGKPLGRP